MIEYIATTLTLIGVVFNVLQKRICFVIWFIGNCMWIYIQLKADIYGMALCQGVFCGTCIWGWIAWRPKSDLVPTILTKGSIPNNIPPKYKKLAEKMNESNLDWLDKNKGR